MPIVAFCWKLDMIRVFLNRAVAVEDEHTRLFDAGCAEGDSEGEPAYEKAGDILIAYQEIVVRAAMHELNALVEHELKHLASSLLAEDEVSQSPRLDRRKACCIIERRYPKLLESLPGYSQVEHVRNLVNAYKHNEGLKREEHPFLRESYELRWKDALDCVDAVEAFLRALPGSRSHL